MKRTKGREDDLESRRGRDGASPQWHELSIKGKRSLCRKLLETIEFEYLSDEQECIDDFIDYNLKNGDRFTDVKAAVIGWIKKWQPKPRRKVPLNGRVPRNSYEHTSKWAKPWR